MTALGSIAAGNPVLVFDTFKVSRNNNAFSNERFQNASYHVERFA